MPSTPKAVLIITSFNWHGDVCISSYRTVTSPDASDIWTSSTPTDSFSANDDLIGQPPHFMPVTIIISVCIEQPDSERLCVTSKVSWNIAHNPHRASVHRFSAWCHRVLLRTMGPLPCEILDSRVSLHWPSTQAIDSDYEVYRDRTECTRDREANSSPHLW